MKLRIRGNSIRLRLTQSEVARIENSEIVSETLSFGGLGDKTSTLTYSLESSDEVSELEARFENQRIRVFVPRSLSTRWTSSSEVSIKKKHDLGRGETLSILVEKDFVCLKPREFEFEDESDLFKNPNETHGSCS
jgi:hypothetical protein